MGILRLLLAVAVVVAHASTPAGFSFLEMTGGPLAVQIFYEISGFYMAMILSERYVGQERLAAFYTNRLLRLFPVFFVALLGTVVLLAALSFFAGYDAQPVATWRRYGAELSPLGWLALGLSNLTLVGQDWVYFLAVDPHTAALSFSAKLHAAPLPGWKFLFVPQAWTVGLELSFYAIAPLIVRRKLWVIGGLLLLSLVLRVAMMRTFELWHDPWTYRFFPTELALFLAGVLSYRLFRFWEARRAPRDRGLELLVTIVAVAGIAGYALLPESLKPYRYGLSPVLALLPLAFPFMFSATRASRVDRRLGELSYPLYIVHYAFVFAAPALTGPLAHHASWLVLGTSVVAAVLVLRLVAEPIERTRERISLGIPVHPRSTKATS